MGGKSIKIRNTSSGKRTTKNVEIFFDFRKKPLSRKKNLQVDHTLPSENSGLFHDSHSEGVKSFYIMSSLMLGDRGTKPHELMKVSAK